MRIDISHPRDDDALWHDAAVPGHIREGASVGEFLTPPRPGVFLVDCSCGAEYEVPQGGDEYGAIEEAHRAHVAAILTARRALHGGTDPDGLDPAARAEYDRLLAQVKQGLEQ